MSTDTPVTPDQEKDATPKNEAKDNLMAALFKARTVDRIVRDAFIHDRLPHQCEGGWFTIIHLSKVSNHTIAEARKLVDYLAAYALLDYKELGRDASNHYYRVDLTREKVNERMAARVQYYRERLDEVIEAEKLMTALTDNELSYGEKEEKALLLCVYKALA